ncbi:MAG: hypothetical protein ACI9OJ_005931, partial [Myxococcota bacterium]
MNNVLKMVLVLGLAACANSNTGSSQDDDAGGTDGNAGFVIGSDTAASDAASTDSGTAPEIAVSDSEESDIIAPDAAETEPDTSAPDASEPFDAPMLSEDGKVVLNPETHQFSFIAPLDKTLTKNVAIYNGGGGALTITGVEMAPGGSTDFFLLGVPPLPRTLHTGEHQLALVGFKDGSGGQGKLLVHTDDPETPTAELILTSHIKATLPQPCGLLKPDALNFGSVIRGESKTLTAVLSNCSQNQALSLLQVTRSGGFFGNLTDEFQITPEPQSPIEVGPASSLTLSVTYTPLLAGPDFGHFVLHTDDPEDAQLTLTVQGLGVAPPPESLGITIRLSWDANFTDVDSHLLNPGGTLFDCTTDCFFGNPAPDWGTAGAWQDDPFLDLDDVDGYGPEHINLTEPQPGVYRYVVHYWDDTY